MTAPLSSRCRILRACFVVYGLFTACGIFFVFIPDEMMVRIGEAFGLPPFEVTPVFEYMARGMSSLCFLVGALLVYCGLHLGESARLIRFLGWIALASLPAAVFIHAVTPTPAWWKAGGIVAVALLCVMCFAVPVTDAEGGE